MPNNSDILSQLQDVNDGDTIDSTTEVVRSLKRIESLLKDGNNISQQQFKNGFDRDDDRRLTAQESRRRKKRNPETFTEQFEAAFKDSLLDSFGGNKFKKEMQSIMQTFADDVGISVKDIPEKFGKELGEKVVGSISNTKFMKSFQEKQQKELDNFKKKVFENYKQATGRDLNPSDSNPEEQVQSTLSVLKEELPNIIKDKVQSKFGDQIDIVKDKISEGISKGTQIKDKAASKLDSVKEKGKNFVSDKVTTVKDKALDKMGPLGEKLRGTKLLGGTAKAGAAGAEGAASITKALTSVMKAGVGSLAKSFAPLALLEVVSDAIMRVGAAIGTLLGGLQAAANRDQVEREKRIENRNARIEADKKAIVEAEYQVIKDAAQSMLDIWDQNLSKITQTQGYSKADLQELIGQYATRLRDEGLDSVISAGSITENLTKVLESGMQGVVAQEFAYIATKLNAAIPTQDFFNYSEAYASIIANQIKEGKSQTAAIESANKQLETFASNILYANHQISGGLSSGLQNANEIYNKSVQIAAAAKNYESIPDVSSILASVSAITGAIAPDLAEGIVDAVYQAAVGGNDSSIVALRSLAGVNAGNTAFLQEFMNNPQKIFSTLFKNLSDMQNMSPDNYMEVAEGLSSVFGLDKAALQRVDFAYLADAINSMTTNNVEIDKALTLLESGQTTLSAEQMKMKQINEYMIDEGLAYVLDNQVARSIQENMWAEQRANKIMENQFAVDLQGKSMSALSALTDLIGNIFRGITGIFLGPANIAQTMAEIKEGDEKVQQILKEGLVGNGREQDLKNLTSSIDMMQNNVNDELKRDMGLTHSYLSMIKDATDGTASNTYKWAQVGKSVQRTLGTISGTVQASYNETKKQSQQVTNSANLSRLQSNFDRMKDTMSKFTSTGVQESLDTSIQKETKKQLSKFKVSSSAVNKLAKTFMSKEYGMSQDLAKQRAKIELTKQAEESAKAAATQVINQKRLDGKLGQTGYDAWVQTASKFGISDFNEAIKELGYSENDLKNYFNQMETADAVLKKEERDQKEEAFWEETQSLLNTLNINIHDVFDKTDMMGIFYPMVKKELEFINYNKGGITEQFKAFRSDFMTFYTNWYNHNIKHTTYSKALWGTDLAFGGTYIGDGYTSGSNLLKKLDAINKSSKKTDKDRMNALTEQLTKLDQIGDLMDPTVQTNVLLAQVVQLLQAIFQQNNTQGKLSLPDSIAALATGYTEVKK